MNVGGSLPTPLARKIVPKLPSFIQRFHASRSWEAAVAESIGYANCPVPEVSISKYQSWPIRGNNVALVAAFGSAIVAAGMMDKKIRVLDFGGFDGRHAQLIKGSFPSLNVDWTVVDLPSVVEVTSALALPDLNFRSDLASALATNPDIVLASASLNYIEDPESTIRLLAMNSRSLILSRLPLWPIEMHQAAIQRPVRRSRAISYPTWFFSEAEFRKLMLEIGDISMEFECPDDRAYFGGHYLSYRGVVTTLRPEAP